MQRSLEVLDLAGNQISDMQVSVFRPLTSMTLLNLADNRMTSVHFKTFLSIHTSSTHILLEQNPWSCDCALQRVFRKLRSIQRLLLDDYHNLTCREPEARGARRLADAELCLAETVTVLVITGTVLAAVLMGERRRKKEKKRKHWTQQGAQSDESDS